MTTILIEEVVLITDGVVLFIERQIAELDQEIEVGVGRFSRRLCGDPILPLNLQHPR